MFLFSLRLFSAAAVDIVVLEVGVGGRLDSTNAVSPVACGITALGMDHMEILGDTIESIAFEKAGIAKPNVPCFTSCQRDFPQTIDVIREQAAKVNAPLTVVDGTWYDGTDWSVVRRRGDHMVENCRLALALSRSALGLDLKAPVTSQELAALESSAYPGRSHTVPGIINGAKFYLDGAHTPESMRVAAKWFFEAAERDGWLPKQKAVLLFFSSRDNRKLLSAFLPYATKIEAIVFVTFPHDSSQLPNTGVSHLHRAHEAWRSLVDEHGATTPGLADIRSSVLETPLTTVEDLTGAARGPLEVETRHTVPVLCTGSLYLIGAVMQTLSKATATPPEA